MRRPIDAYREGYEKARKDDLGRVTGELLMGMLRDDPGGHFEKGYLDGRAGKPFSPPIELREPPAAANPFGKKTAVRAICPNCGALDWFEWKFLGRLTDPVCGHTCFAGSGTYAWMQLRAALLSGSETARHLTSGVERQPSLLAELTGWMFKGMIWLFGAILGIFVRLEVGLPMIPIQALVGLGHDRDKKHSYNRYVALGISVLAAIVITYAIRHNPTLQPGQPQAAAIRPITSTVSPVLTMSPAQFPRSTTGESAVRAGSFAQPSFDCSKARTATELLLCRDPNLAALEVGMVSAYDQAVNRQTPDGRRKLRQDHLDWFRNYSRTCNEAGNDADRAICVRNFLSAHTAELNNR